MNHFFAPLELKFAQDDAATGTFQGYGSVFGNIDSHGDMIAPGAFKTSLAEFAATSRKVSMYMQHGFGDPRPVGVWDVVEEDAKGLRVEGRLLGLDTETGRYNYSLVKGGAIQGLSIGFRAVKADYPKEPGKAKRVLKEVKLYEVSLVDQPSNPAAQVADVKSAMAECQSFAELERFLRAEYRMTRSEVMALVARAKALDLSDSVEGKKDGDLSDSVDVASLVELVTRRNIK